MEFLIFRFVIAPLISKGMVIIILRRLLPLDRLWVLAKTYTIELLLLLLLLLFEFFEHLFVLQFELSEFFIFFKLYGDPWDDIQHNSVKLQWFSSIFIMVIIHLFSSARCSNVCLLRVCVCMLVNFLFLCLLRYSINLFFSMTRFAFFFFQKANWLIEHTFQFFILTISVVSPMRKFSLPI